VDEDGKLLGIVAMRDVIKSRKTGSLAIINNIESRNTIEEISELHSEVDQVLQALLVERATVIEITSLITEFYDRITRKIIEICEREWWRKVMALHLWVTVGLQWEAAEGKNSMPVQIRIMRLFMRM
jgi:CBS domain-containing protein